MLPCAILKHTPSMNIVLGITGSIAAYKACSIIRLLVKAGHEVQVVITPAGKEFITPITLSALTSKPVISDFFSQRDGTWHSHVSLGLWADAMLIAPATASTIGKMAHGIADNMLITTYLSMKAPVFLAPAMDLDMWAHPSTQENLSLLRQRGVTVIEPASGELASHLVGKGRMEEPEKIVESLLCALNAPSHPANAAAEASPLAGQRILLTAGPTYERIDPVRFIGNYSSGKMGIALAEECARRGAEVELVLGPTPLRPAMPYQDSKAVDAPAAGQIRITSVESAAEMHEAATHLYATCRSAILCAAVADFTPDQVAEQKIKRVGNDLILHLCPTPDIARALGEMKRSYNDGLKADADGKRKLLVGFALETHDELQHAREKMERKNLDFIVLNSLQDEGAGFRYDTNKITIVSRDTETAYPLKSKVEVAKDIIDRLTTLL